MAGLIGTDMWEGRHNYELNAATVLRDLYRLLTMALSDDAIAAVATENEDPLVTLRERFIEDELVHLLIGTAVVNRSQDDHMRGPREDQGEMSFHPLRYECGSLIANVENDEIQPLSFREACNKIIHAQHITAEVEERSNRAYPVMPPVITIRGVYHRTPWEARLNIIEYVRASVLNFDVFG